MELVMVVSKPSLTGIIKRVPWIALFAAVVAIGYCAGLWVGGMSTFEKLQVCMPSTDIEACINSVESKVILPDIALVIDLVGLLFGVFALWVACSGLNTWKSELKHKRDIELFDFLMIELEEINFQLGSLGYVLKRVRIESSRGSDAAHPNTLDAELKLNHKLALISLRIQRETVLNVKLLDEFRYFEKVIRELILFLSGLHIEPKISPLDRDKFMELEDKEDRLISAGELQLNLFKEYLRKNLTAG
jgi:hypothetical protein